MIDDGSRDDSVSVIRRVLAESPIPNELVSRGNRGLSATLNEGFERSTGEFFAYLGSDDVWLPNFLEEQAALLESRPDAVLAYCHAYVIDEQDQIVDRTDKWSDFAEKDILKTLLTGQIFSSPGVLYRRSALERHRWNEDAALEDYELYLRLSADGEFARNAKLLCGWRQHGWNTSGDFPKMLAEWVAAQERARPFIPLSDEELDKLRHRLRFKSAAGFVRAGRRGEALELVSGNLTGAASVGEIATALLRIATPRSLFEWNRRRMRDAAIKRYGKLHY